MPEMFKCTTSNMFILFPFSCCNVLVYQHCLVIPYCTIPGVCDHELKSTVLPIAS